MMIKKNMAFEPNKPVSLEAKLKLMGTMPAGGPRALQTESTMSLENRRGSSNIGTERHKNKRQLNMNSSEKSLTQKSSETYKKFVSQNLVQNNR